MPVIDKDEWVEGQDCEGCGRFGRVHAWTVYGTLIKVLAELYRLGGTDDWVTVAEMRAAGRVTEFHTKSIGRLRFWGLAEQRRGHRDDGGKDGAWRCTEKGRLYLQGVTRLPEKIWVFGAKCVDEEGPMLTVHDAWKGPFDLHAHLNNYNEERSNA